MCWKDFVLIATCWSQIVAFRADVSTSVELILVYYKERVLNTFLVCALE